MPNAIEQRLAALLDQRRLKTLARVDRLTRRVGAIYDRMGRQLLRLSSVPEADTGRRNDPATAQAFNTVHELLYGAFTSEIEEGHRTAVGAMLQAIPWRWFRVIHPMVIEAEEPVIDGLTKEQKREIIEKLLFPPPDADTVARYLDQAGPDGQNWDDRLRHWEEPTQDHIRSQLIQGMSADEGVPKLRRRLLPIVGDIRYKAQRIARTEGRRMAEIGQDDAWNEASDLIDGFQVLAAFSHTRPEHAARHGTIYRQKADGSYVADNGDLLPILPDAPNCVLPGQEVSGAFSAGLRARYEGQAIELRTASDAVVRVTGNHPILTAYGWVPAHQLRKGFKLVRHEPSVKRPRMVADYENHEPALIEQVFSALSDTGTIAESSAGRFNFHGDEQRCQGNIDVVAIDRELLVDGVPPGYQFGRNPCFQRRDMQFFGVSGGRSCSLDSIGVGTAFACLPGGRESLLNHGAVALDVAPTHQLRIGPTADLHALLSESASERYASTPLTFGELLYRGTGEVLLDQVVEIREFQWSGHVYDLQTDWGWYACNGIIVHNCLCYKSPILKMPKELENDPYVKAQFQNANKATIPDPGSYRQWWATADEAERRRGVGGRRYNLVAKRLASQGRMPEWEDFLTADGKLMPIDKLKRQTWKAWDGRRAKVAELIAHREQVMRQVTATGFEMP